MGGEKSRPIAYRETWIFGIAVDWKATLLEAKVWVQTVTEDGRRFTAAWRKYIYIDAARYHQETREATRLGKLLPHTEE